MSKQKHKTFFHNTYQEESLIGEGSYGKVYKAKNMKKKSSEVYAIKNIKVEKSKQEIENLKYEGLTENEIKDNLNEILQSCEAEIKLMNDLKGSNHVVNIEDYEVLPLKNGFGFELNIRMELLERIEVYFSEKNPTSHDILKLGLDISKALRDCNKINIIHRDIKPDNIFINKFGDYKLGDFGIARNLEKTTSGLSQKGTFNYIAPEVYKGSRYNKTVDYYSLGLVIYKYFNYNRLPFLPPYPEKITVNSREEAVMKRAEGEIIPPPINATEEEATVILKMLAYNSKDRYQNIEECIKDIEELLKKEERIIPWIEKKESKVNTNLSVSKTELEKQKEGIEKTKFSKKLLIPIPIILVIISVISFFIYQNNNYVLVPNLVSEESTIALTKLDKLKINYKVKYKVVEESKVGKILSQNIKNKKIKKDKIVKLTAGISNEKVEMIDVVGLTKEEAIKKLESLGLKVSISEEYSEGTEKDKVLSQMTEKGKKINKGTVVELLISKGKQEKEEEKIEETKKETKEETKPENKETPKENNQPVQSPPQETQPPVKEKTHVTSISLKGIYIAREDKTLLSINYLPEDADDYEEIRNKKVVWSNSNPAYVNFDGRYATKNSVNYTTCLSPVTLTATIDGTSLTASYKIYFERKNADYDVNGDGKINSDDGGTIASNVNNGIYMDPSKYDFNCDGVVNSLDVEYPTRYYASHK